MRFVAYGSLLNQQSLERSLGRKAPLKPMVIDGVCRVFDAPFGRYAFGNLKFDGHSSIEAAWFELAEAELEKFAEREAGSELRKVRPGLWAFVWPAATCRNLPVLQSYLDVCQTGALQLQIDFWQGTALPEQIIDDRQRPLYF